MVCPHESTTLVSPSLMTGGLPGPTSLFQRLPSMGLNSESLYVTVFIYSILSRKTCLFCRKFLLVSVFLPEASVRHTFRPPSDVSSGSGDLRAQYDSGRWLPLSLESVVPTLRLSQMPREFFLIDTQKLSSSTFFPLSPFSSAPVGVQTKNLQTLPSRGVGLTPCTFFPRLSPTRPPSTTSGITPDHSNPSNDTQ